MTKKIVSILLVLTLAFSVLAGSSFAAAGDVSLTNDWYSDGYIFFQTSAGFDVSSSSSSTISDVDSLSSSSSGAFSHVTFIQVLPFDSSSYTCTIPLSALSLSSSATFNGFSATAYSLSNPPNAYLFTCNVNSTSSSVVVSSPSSFSGDNIRFIVCVLYFSDYQSVTLDKSSITYTITYSPSSSGSGSGYDPSLDQDILDGVEAIAQSLLDLETGPYTTTSGVSLNSNGVVTPTTVQQATLEQLLSLIGATSTYSGLVLEQMNLNFGNYFEYYETSDSTSGTVTVVRNLPAYVNAVGGELTDGINKLQRDNVLLYQQGENIEDALYTDKAENQPWSVAQWLKDIYTAITSFFSSFWSPAETDLKTASEDGMQAAADNGNAATGSQVSDVNSAADAFKEFGSTGNIGSGDVMDIFSDGASYDFFSQSTKDNLAYHPPAGGRRNLRSSSPPVESDQSEEEYVDELDDKLSYWREVLGLP